MDMWNGVRGKFILNVSKLGMPKGTSLYLEDSFTKTTVKLTAGTKYPFTTTTDPKTEHNRFYLRFEGKPEIDTIITPPVDTTKDTTKIKIKKDKKTKKITLDIAPNPIGTGFMNIDITSKTGQPVTLRLINMMGQELYRKEAKDFKTGIVKIPVDNLLPGNYIVEVISGDERVVKQVLKL